MSTPSGDVLVAVVSDGAGSAKESGQGSRFICDDLTSRLSRSLSTSDIQPTEEWLRICVAETRDALIEEAKGQGLPSREFAATMLCAVLGATWSAFAQIGDGAIVTPEDGIGVWNWLFWPHRGEYANTTFFLTETAAMSVLEIGVLNHRQSEIAMFTDGLQHMVLNYEEQSVHSPFFERMIRPVRDSPALGSDQQLSEQLAKYLGTSAVTSRTDDDLTLILASRISRGAGRD